MLGDWVAEWIDTSQTVMTTRATAELKKNLAESPTKNDYLMCSLRSQVQLPENIHDIC